MTTEEISNQLFNYLSRNWVVSFDESTISIIHSRPTTVINKIEIDLENNSAEAEVLNETIYIPCKVQNFEQALEIIKELITISIARHSTVCKRLEKAISDIREE